MVRGTHWPLESANEARPLPARWPPPRRRTRQARAWARIGCLPRERRPFSLVAHRLVLNLPTSSGPYDSSHKVRFLDLGGASQRRQDQPTPDSRTDHSSSIPGQCYPARVGTQVIVLNGTSSSGKTSIARCLQSMLTTPRLLLGIDDLTRAAPDKGINDGTLLRVSETGHVEIGPGWQSLETSWYIGIATIAAHGTGLIVDEVFLDGGAGQERLRKALRGLEVLWVGVTCDHEVARAREALRPDRVAGQADSQALVVHEGVEYDLIVDTSHVTSESCAALILDKASTLA